MTDLRIEQYVMPAAELGPENPLPDFRAPEHDRHIDADAHNIPLDDRVGLGWQAGKRVLPYRHQDGYTRQRQERAFTAIVLENEMLKVIVLPEVGGKAISITHKPLQRELLLCNPMFQPGNLALRNAWTSGGIEWNTPHPGHHYLTCSPIHAAQVTGTGGEPVLRLCAWDRVKRFPYQLDLHLPPGSPFLYTTVRLINPHDYEIAMYWWTNIGVPEYPGGRVLCPADTAHHGLTVKDCPVVDGVDHSYPQRVAGAYDLFFRIPDGQRRWEVGVDAGGAGLVHTSTDRLRSRKIFAWGMGPGGRHWNDYLQGPNLPYIELQAGLAPTQSYLVPMPAGAQWTWTEALGYFEADPQRLHDSDWQAAYRYADEVLEGMLPAAEVDDFHRQAEQVMIRPPEQTLFRGLGWGALEKQRCAASEEDCGIPDELPFDDGDLGDEQAPWLELLQHGALPRRDPQDDPGQYMTQPQWQNLLERSITSGAGDHWLSWLHLGVMRMETGDSDGAREAWQTSLKRTENGWALRNLATLALREDDPETAAQLLARALQVGPVIAALASEYGQLLLRLKRYDALRGLLDSLPEEVRAHERVMLLGAQAALHFGDWGHVERVLQHEFATIREGEVSLSDLWFEMHTRRLAQEEGVPADDALRARVEHDFPPPAVIDYRMSVGDGAPYVPPQGSES